MIQGNSSGVAGAVPAFRAVDMAIFDELPEQVRLAIKGAAFNYQSADFRAILATNPPERVAALVSVMDRKLLDREAAHARAA